MSPDVELAVVVILTVSIPWFFAARYWNLRYHDERIRANFNKILYEQQKDMLDTTLDMLIEASGNHLRDMWELAELKMHTLESEMEKVSMMGRGVWVRYDKYRDRGMFTILLGDERLCDTDEPAKALREYREKLDEEASIRGGKSPGGNDTVSSTD